MGKLLVAPPPHHCNKPSSKDGFGMYDDDRRGSVFQCDCGKIYIFFRDHYDMSWHEYNPNRRHIWKWHKEMRKYYQIFLEAQRD